MEFRKKCEQLAGVLGIDVAFYDDTEKQDPFEDDGSLHIVDVRAKLRAAFDVSNGQRLSAADQNAMTGWAEAQNHRPRESRAVRRGRGRPVLQSLRSGDGLVMKVYVVGSNVTCDMWQVEGVMEDLDGARELARLRRGFLFPMTLNEAAPEETSVHPEFEDFRAPLTPFEVEFNRRVAERAAQQGWR